MKRFDNPVIWLKEDLAAEKERIIYCGREYSLAAAKRLIVRVMAEIEKDEKQEEDKRIKKERMEKMFLNRLEWIRKSCIGDSVKMKKFAWLVQVNANREEKMEVTPTNFDEKIEEMHSKIIKSNKELDERMAARAKEYGPVGKYQTFSHFGEAYED